MKQYMIFGEYRTLPDFIFKIIKNDKKWFYSLYNDEKGKYLLLRVSKSYSLLDIELKKKKIKYKKFSYMDIHECGMTMKYFNDFVSLFHAESVLIQKIDKKEKLKILERIIHLAFNMAGYTYAAESYALSSLSLERMFICGNTLKK